jgi:hypothetical protein
VARDVISTCPVCEGELAITRLHCRTCGTTLEGEFGVGRFGRLSREQLALLESFLRSRGNLKDLERELGISYPTVRGRVEALLRALGLADGAATAVEEPTEADAPSPASDHEADERRAILDRLSRHEISAEDAAEALRALGAA